MEKICGACRKSKALDDFPPNRKNRDGLNTKCRECYNEYMRAWYQKNGDTHRARVNSNRTRASKYGLTETQLVEMLGRFDGKCWLCKKRKAKAVDHCHKSGTVRGVLCVSCNTSLGKLGDTVESLQAAIMYLQGTP